MTGEVAFVFIFLLIVLGAVVHELLRKSSFELKLEHRAETKSEALSAPEEIPAHWRKP